MLLTKLLLSSRSIHDRAIIYNYFFRAITSNHLHSWKAINNALNDATVVISSSRLIWRRVVNHHLLNQTSNFDLFQHTKIPSLYPSSKQNCVRRKKYFVFRSRLGLTVKSRVFIGFRQSIENDTRFDSVLFQYLVIA